MAVSLSRPATQTVWRVFIITGHIAYIGTDKTKIISVEMEQTIFFKKKSETEWQRSKIRSKHKKVQRNVYSFWHTQKKNKKKKKNQFVFEIVSLPEPRCLIFTGVFQHFTSTCSHNYQNPTFGKESVDSVCGLNPNVGRALIDSVCGQNSNVGRALIDCGQNPNVGRALIYSVCMWTESQRWESVDWQRLWTESQRWESVDWQCLWT